MLSTFARFGSSTGTWLLALALLAGCGGKPSPPQEVESAPVLTAGNEAPSAGQPALTENAPSIPTSIPGERRPHQPLDLAHVAPSAEVVIQLHVKQLVQADALQSLVNGPLLEQLNPGFGISLDKVDRITLFAEGLKDLDQDEVAAGA